MLKARAEITAALEWRVSDSGGWFDLVDGDGREWGAVHVRQYLQGHRPHIDYTARVTPPFGKMQSQEGIEDLASAALWVYAKLSVQGSADAVWETPLGSPSIADDAPARFPSVREAAKNICAALRDAAPAIHERHKAIIEGFRELDAMTKGEKAGVIGEVVTGMATAPATRESIRIMQLENRIAELEDAIAAEKGMNRLGEPIARPLDFHD